ncbi:hypothetical protein ACFW9U_23410 [Rhodococcus aetherivorans]|uniref:hypothetical protein n=1 Tax=Rhodococcus aetherivorans TaxID=191292 RepID=UPI00366D10BB
MNTDYPQEAELPSDFGDLVDPPEDVWMRAVTAAVDAEPVTDLAVLVPFVDSAEAPDTSSDPLLDEPWPTDSQPHPDGDDFDEDSHDIEGTLDSPGGENEGFENDNADMPLDSDPDDGIV